MAKQADNTVNFAISCGRFWIYGTTKLKTMRCTNLAQNEGTWTTFKVQKRWYIPVVFATVSNTISRDLRVEWPEATFPKGDWPGEREVYIEKSVTFSIAGQSEPKKRVWERVTIRKRPYRESKASGLKERSQVKAGFAGQPLSPVKEEEVLDDIAAAACNLIPDAAKEAMLIVLEEMKSVWIDSNADFWDVLEAHGDVVDDWLQGKEDLVLADPPEKCE